MARKLTPDEARMLKALLAEQKELKAMAAYHREQARRFMAQAKALRLEVIADKFELSISYVSQVSKGKFWRDA